MLPASNRPASGGSTTGFSVSPCRLMTPVAALWRAVCCNLLAADRTSGEVGGGRSLRSDLAIDVLELAVHNRGRGTVDGMSRDM
ncbi:MAG TPA: hypothetical protein VNA20_17440 [Frankiaceae bacterium]|nr:hypothetical protein [Frankiaceae bacterium]